MHGRAGDGGVECFHPEHLDLHPGPGHHVIDARVLRGVTIRPRQEMRYTVASVA